jgi:hypothetical protein
MDPQEAISRIREEEVGRVVADRGGEERRTRATLIDLKARKSPLVVIAADAEGGGGGRGAPPAKDLKSWMPKVVAKQSPSSAR